MSTTLRIPSPSIRPIPIGEFLDLMYQESMPPRSRARRKNVKHVSTVLSACDAIETTADLTPETVAKLVAELECKESMRNNFLWTLHRLCNIAVERHWLAFNPMPGVVSMPQRLRSHSALRETRIPTEAEMGDLLRHLQENAGTWNGYRLYALVATVTQLGLTRDEALYQIPADCDLKGSIFTVSKGRRGRALTLAIPGALGPLLADWMPRAGSYWLFPGRSRTSPWTTENQISGAIYQIRRAGQAVGVEGLTFESLRLFHKGQSSLPLDLAKAIDELGDEQRKVLTALYNAGPEGLTGPVLSGITKCNDVGGIVRRLANKSIWEPYVKPAGGTRGKNRFVWPYDWKYD